MGGVAGLNTPSAESVPAVSSSKAGHPEESASQSGSRRA